MLQVWSGPKIQATYDLVVNTAGMGKVGAYGYRKYSTSRAPPVE
jgi:hypothetical protein